MAHSDPEYARRLAEIVTRAASDLQQIPPAVAAARPVAEKWSIKEIVGHLIDSASNNHQRFVRAQWTTDLVFPGYNQDDWVESQRYVDAPWEELVAFWREFNLHLARTMTLIPVEIRERSRHPHNLHQIAFRGVPVEQSVTLDYLMSDYVAHLEHHLAQIARLTVHSP